MINSDRNWMDRVISITRYKIRILLTVSYLFEKKIEEGAESKALLITARNVSGL